MEYFKHKTLSIYLWLAIFVWPVIHYILSPSNHIIFSMLLFTADMVIILNKNRKMIYAEYELVKGTSPNSFASHAWLIFIIFIRVIQQFSAWVVLSCIHIYSPILLPASARERMTIFYFFVVLDIFTEGIYHRCYKKWIISYQPISTNDTELPTFSRKTSD